MAYIGVQPADAYTSFAVQHFTTSATTSYTLDNPVANENEIALFINNVRQEPGSGYAYTASGTSLTLSAATSASDTMYCVFIGKAVQTVTPAVGSVTNDMLAGSIANSKLANSSVTVNGTSISLGASGTISAGITESDVWRLTTSFSGGSATITSNWERADDASSGLLGTGMTQSSGAFSFPSTGIWSIRFTANYNVNNTDDRAIKATINISSDSGSSYDLVSQSYTHIPNQGVGEVYSSSTAGAFVDVTSTSTFRAIFGIASLQSNVNYLGSSTYNQTWVEFIRLGDT